MARLAPGGDRPTKKNAPARRHHAEQLHHYNATEESV